MAKTKTVDAIKDDIETTGDSVVPIAVVEYVTGVAHDDDDTFEATIAALVAAKDWVTGYEINWVNCVVRFTGPWTEPGS